MLNDRARKILAFIQRYSRERGFPPTIREIGEAFGIASTNGVRYYLNLLEKAGQLKRSGGSLAASRVSLPGAGSRRHSDPGPRRCRPADPRRGILRGRLETREIFGDPTGLFALRVRGDSMIDAGIFENDYVVVRHQDHASPGEIVVAHGRERGHGQVLPAPPRSVDLVPANPKHRAHRRSRPDQEFRILGIVKGVVRILKS